MIKVRLFKIITFLLAMYKTMSHIENFVPLYRGCGWAFILPEMSWASELVLSQSILFKIGTISSPDLASCLSQSSLR